jgi:Transposase DDE domain
LAKVRDLNGHIINGYNTFNSIVLSDVDKQIRLLASTPYSTADPHYNQAIGAGFCGSEIVLTQLTQTDQALKAAFPGVQVNHLLDRGHDDESVFEHIDDLQSHFTIRLKANRNSDESTQSESGKAKAVKLQQAQLAHTYDEILTKFIWKQRVYEQARLVMSVGVLSLNGRGYQVVRVSVFDRLGKSIFKEPMLLITNRLLPDFKTVFSVYQSYLRRSKIEGVFKFLKEKLGWEELRVRDFMAIQNLLSLCFYVGGYFYEHRQELVGDVGVGLICQLALSKGKVTLHFYLEGLKILANYQLAQAFIKEHNLTQEDVNEMISHLH